MNVNKNKTKQSWSVKQEQTFLLLLFFRFHFRFKYFGGGGGGQLLVILWTTHGQRFTLDLVITFFPLFFFFKYHFIGLSADPPNCSVISEQFSAHWKVGA